METILKERWGLLFMTYGSPETQSDIKDFYTRIRGGREPSEVEVNVLQKRYAAIKKSPLLTHNEEQVCAVADMIYSRFSIEMPYYLGCLYAKPYMYETFYAMKDAGITKVIGLPGTPFDTPATRLPYAKMISDVSEQYHIPVTMVSNWYDDGKLALCWAQRIMDVLQVNGLERLHEIAFIFTAHSIPQMVVDAGDAYTQQISDLISQILVTIDIPKSAVYQAWQSAGTRGTWLQPTISEVLQRVYSEGYKIAVIIPVGFITEHLEVLYDNDIECKNFCELHDMIYLRPIMPNTNTYAVEAMTNAVYKAMGDRKDK